MNEYDFKIRLVDHINGLKEALDKAQEFKRIYDLKSSIRCYESDLKSLKEELKELENGRLP